MAHTNRHWLQAGCTIPAFAMAWFGAGQGGFQAAFHQPLAHLPHLSGYADIEGFADVTVAPAWPFGANVSFQQDLCVLAFIRRRFAYLYQLFGVPVRCCPDGRYIFWPLSAPSIEMEVSMAHEQRQIKDDGVLALEWYKHRQETQRKQANIAMTELNNLANEIRQLQWLVKMGGETGQRMMAKIEQMKTYYWMKLESFRVAQQGNG